MRFVPSKRTLVVGALATLTLGGGAAVAASAHADDRPIYTEAEAGMIYLVKQGECRGTVRTDTVERGGGWVSRVEFRPSGPADSCGFSVVSLNTLKGTADSPELDGPFDWTRGDADGPLSAEALTWQPSGGRGFRQPVTSSMAVLCETGYEVTLNSTGDGLDRMDPDYCTMYVFDFL